MMAETEEAVCQRSGLAAPDQHNGARFQWKPYVLWIVVHCEIPRGLIVYSRRCKMDGVYLPAGQDGSSTWVTRQGLTQLGPLSTLVEDAQVL